METLTPKPKLTLLEITDLRTHDKRVLAKYSCSCGAVVLKPKSRVQDGSIKHCGGVIHRPKPNLTHGQKYSPEYTIWIGIKNRIFNPHSKDYERYGSRVGMSDRLAVSFEAFYEEVGPRPNKNYSIDRIDNNKGYVEGNLRWATASEQQRNRKDSVWLNVDGVRIHINEYANQIGISRGAAHKRLRRGKLGVRRHETE